MSDYFTYNYDMFNFDYALTQQPKQEHFSMHTQDRAELYGFMGGSGIFHIEGTEYALEPGDILIMAPGESHYIEVDCSQPYARWNIHFEKELLQSIDPRGVLMTPFLDRRMGTMNRYKSYEFRGGSKFYWDAMTVKEGDRQMNVLTGMLSLLNDIYSIYLSRDAEAHAAGNTVEYRIIRYINKNLSSDISLDEICRKFFISKSQLCRLFKKATGSTLWQYITIKRLTKARLMLREGEKPTKVCFECGFNDYSAFYRAYTKHYGYGPNLE